MDSRAIPPIVTLCGVVAFLFAWFVATLYDPDWTYGVNMMSELGIAESEMSRALFNYGCMVGGGGVIVFGVGRLMASNKPLFKMATVPMLFAGLFLMLVGVFPMDFGDGNTHDMVATMMAIFLMVSLLVQGIDDVAGGRRNMGILAFAIFIISVMLALTTPLAFFEPTATILVAIWFTVLAYLMLIGKSDIGSIG